METKSFTPPKMLGPTSQQASSDDASANIQAAVKKATTPVSAGGEMEGNPVGMAEISQFVVSNKNAVNDLVKCLKQRVKDSNEQVSFTSLCVLDECMRVQKSMLKRLAIMAQPYGGYPSKIREKAASLLLSWGQLYGSDPRLEKFRVAGAQVRKREVQEVAGAFKDERSQLEESADAVLREQVQRVARDADIKEIHAAMLEMGVEPEIAAYAAAEHKAARAQQKQPEAQNQSQSQSQSSYAMSGADLGPGATTFLNARPDRVPPSRPLHSEEPAELPSAPVEDASEAALRDWRALKPKAREQAELLAAMMQGESAEAVASNAETAALAAECEALQSKICDLVASIAEEAEIVECVSAIEALAAIISEWHARKSGGPARNSNGIHKSAMLESESSFLVSQLRAQPGPHSDARADDGACELEY